MTPQEKWRQQVATALTDWRLFSIGPRPSIQYEQQLIRSAVAECLTIRLTAACAPLFQTLQRIENRVGILCDLRADPYAPPPKVKQ